MSSATLSEIVVNSILHRSYVIEAPLRVFIFDNRIEIHSPGLLPEGVNMESIKHGVSVPRNKLLFNHGIHLLPYTGAGSGIIRAMQFTPGIKFTNDEMLNEFVVTIEREGIEVDDRVNDRDDRDNKLNDNGNSNSQQNQNDRVDDKERVGASNYIPYKKLDGIQKDIIQFCNIPRSAREILEHIGYRYHPSHLVKFIKPLLSMGYIEMTDPDKPNSRNQKYRKVSK